MTDYQPISCELHDTYERYVVEKRKLRMDWHEDNGSRHQGVVEPRNLYTQQGVEYMAIRQPNGHETALRLDCIDAVEPL